MRSRSVEIAKPGEIAKGAAVSPAVGDVVRLKDCVQHPSFNGQMGALTKLAEDGRWHMFLTGQALGFHLRYVKVQNFEVLRPPTAGQQEDVAPSLKGQRETLIRQLAARPNTPTTMAAGRSSSTTLPDIGNADHDIPNVLMIYLPDGRAVPAIEHKGSASTIFFRNAHHMLCEFDEVADPSTDVVFEDDHDEAKDPSTFVDIHTAWKACGGTTAPCSIAKCKQTGAWGIGMSWTKKYRVMAAKLSLAVALGMSHNNLHKIVATQSGQAYPEIRKMLDFAENAGICFSP